MIIDLEKILEECSEIKQDVKMAHKFANVANFIDPVYCTAMLRSVSNHTYIDINFSGTIVLECARCLETFDKTISGNYSIILKEASSGTPCGLCEEDIAVYYYKASEKNEIDLRQSLYEEIITRQPIMPLCKSDCPGILFEKSIESSVSSTDPRWNALIKLKQSGNNRSK